MATSLLLADDSPTIAKILGMALASEEYQIRSVLTADEAIRELRSNPPFFFLVDLTLPGKNGFELTELIRADSKLARIKVVLLSSAFEPLDEDAVRACGADLVIAKPFDPAELRASLRSIKDAPPKFASGSKVSGSLSGQTVRAPEKTSLTNTDLLKARTVISKTIEAPAPEELLLGMQNDLDANSILAGLAENAPAAPFSGIDIPPPAPPSGDIDLSLDLGSELESQSMAMPPPENATTMLDLSGSVPSQSLPETVLDLSGSFSTPPGGTAMMDMASVDFNGELVLPEGPPKAPVEFEKPPAPNRSMLPPMATKPSPAIPVAPLSPNAEALAAFFAAEIEGNQSSPAAPSVANEEDFEKSLTSIDWDQSAKTDLDSWSASPQSEVPSAPPSTAPAITPQKTSTSIPRPTSAPARSEPLASTSDVPPPRSPARAGSGATGEPASFLFDTGGSNFRFAEDYITRITKSFVGNPAEEMPKDFSPEEAPVFRQQSNDSPRPSMTGGGGAENWNPMDAQKMEQIVREEVQMAVREVVEKVAWEVIPELAENIIKKELERVMKQLES